MKMTSRPEEQIFHQLLRNRRPSANTPAFLILFGGKLDRMPIESVVIIEARVLSGNHRMLKIGRDLA